MPKAKQYSQMIHARVGMQLKHESERVFQTLGITTTEAIRQFLNYVVVHQTMPFAKDETNHLIEGACLQKKFPIFSSYG